MRLVFDIETPMVQKDDEDFNDRFFHKNAKAVSLICSQDVDTGESWVFHNDENFPRDGDIKDGIKQLFTAELLIAHNGRAFDIPALGHIFPKLKDRLTALPLFDSCVASRQMFSWKRLQTYDAKYDIEQTEYAKKSMNSLDAWGGRLSKWLDSDLEKLHEFQEGMDWTTLPVSNELIDYCIRDVVVNAKLFHVLLKEKERADEKS